MGTGFMMLTYDTGKWSRFITEGIPRRNKDNLPFVEKLWRKSFSLQDYGRGFKSVSLADDNDYFFISELQSSKTVKLLEEVD